MSDIIISDEMAKRISRNHIGQGNRSGIGQLVTADSVFAPENAKEIEDKIREGLPDPAIQTNTYLVEGRGKRKYFDKRIENHNKVIDI